MQLLVFEIERFQVKKKIIIFFCSRLHCTRVIYSIFRLGNNNNDNDNKKKVDGKYINNVFLFKIELDKIPQKYSPYINNRKEFVFILLYTCVYLM